MSSDVYEAARRNGQSHDEALDAMGRGYAKCWCGREGDAMCSGGAQRFVGCPLQMPATRALKGVS